MKNFIPTLLTAFSTALGFLSFATSKVDPIASMGILTSIGTLLAWLFTYTILGPLMLKFPAKGKKKKQLKADRDILNRQSARYVQLR